MEATETTWADKRLQPGVDPRA
eukprot:gene26804-biopygen17384